MCCHGSQAAAIPHVTLVFHLQQERDLFSSQTLFPCKHFTGMRVRMSMCVCLETQFGCFILPNGSRKKSIDGVYIFFLEKALLCLCICPCSIGILVSVSVIFAVYSFPEGRWGRLLKERGGKRGGERDTAQSRKRKMLICEPHEDEEVSCGGHKSAETQAVCLHEADEKEYTAEDKERYMQKFMYDVRGRTEGN